MSGRYQYRAHIPEETGVPLSERAPWASVRQRPARCYPHALIDVWRCRCRTWNPVMEEHRIARRAPCLWCGRVYNLRWPKGQRRKG